MTLDEVMAVVRSFAHRHVTEQIARAAIEQYARGDAEPVAVIYRGGLGGPFGKATTLTKWCDASMRLPDGEHKLYTRPSRPLTDDRLENVIANHVGSHELTDDEHESMRAFARAIERAHGITAGSSATAPEHPQGSA